MCLRTGELARRWQVAGLHLQFFDRQSQRNCATAGLLPPDSNAAAALAAGSSCSIGVMRTVLQALMAAFHRQMPAACAEKAVFWVLDDDKRLPRTGTTRFGKKNWV